LSLFLAGGQSRNASSLPLIAAVSATVVSGDVLDRVLDRANFRATYTITGCKLLSFISASSRSSIIVDSFVLFLLPRLPFRSAHTRHHSTKQANFASFFLLLGFRRTSEVLSICMSHSENTSKPGKLQIVIISGIWQCSREWFSVAFFRMKTIW
jgi:hypothetical protein